MKYLKTFENKEPEKFIMKYIKTFENKEPEKNIEYYNNGKIRSNIYKLNGQKHREDGPAETLWSEDGKKFCEIYYIDGKKHREDGPAYNIWNIKGEKMAEQYWLNGILYYYKHEWIEKLKIIKSPHYEEQKELYELEQNIEKYNL